MNKALIVEIDRKQGHADILHGSAIVCRASADGSPLLGKEGMVDIWFEGNLNGAENLNTYFEKILCAAGRLVTNYPTIARGAVRRSAVQLLAEYDLRRNFVTKVIDEAGWRRMLDHPAQTYLAPPQPATDVTCRAEIVAQMNRVGFRNLPLTSAPAPFPQAYQFRDGRVLLLRTPDDMQLFWPDDRRIEQLRSLMRPEDYVRIEPELEEAR